MSFARKSPCSIWVCRNFAVIRLHAYCAQSLAQHIVLIALTGWNPRDVAGRIDLSAFDSHLVKPTEIETLEGIIYKVTHRRSNGISPH